MIRWVYAFIDRPRESFERAAQFWTAVTDTHLSSRRGDAQEFATFLPESGDAYLKLQGVIEGGGGHLDFALEEQDIAGEVRRAVDLGAEVLEQIKGFAVLKSPAGLPFCFVTWEGENVRPDVVGHPGGATSRLDQACLDIGPSQYAAEAAFWPAVTGWDRVRGSLPEFEVLRPGPGIPVRILLQRLGQDRPASLHHDLACSDMEQVRAVHEALGARLEHPGNGWLVMSDPVGGSYCLTGRDPNTGSRPTAPQTPPVP
ncbi:MAG TPA: VOC family protein [Actinocrinis sp.]|nr:VOC family protein [Actinocrinis sp.]